jgi:hypothetical protein
MFLTVQDSKGHVSKQLKCTFNCVLILGLTIVLFYFGSPILHKSYETFNDTEDKSQPFHYPDNYSSNSTTPRLCVITRIYGPQIEYFPVLALALRHTGLDNIRIYLTNTDKRTNILQLKQRIKFINEFVNSRDYVTFLDLGEPTTGEDYGYVMTDRALSYVYNQSARSPSICQYVVMTNADNFYSQIFGRKILPYMKAGKDIIAFGFVSHHHKPHYKESIDDKKQTVPQIVDDATGKCTPVELRAGYADLGSVVYRLAFLREHNLHFQRSDESYSFGSDGYFVEQAAGRTKASVILKQTLFVHQ